MLSLQVSVALHSNNNIFHLKSNIYIKHIRYAVSKNPRFHNGTTPITTGKISKCLLFIGNFKNKY